jgi:integrase
MLEIYDAWLPTHEGRVGKSTMDCYKAAWKYFKPLHYLPFADIDLDDLQECVDDCPCGKRTKENMKALGTSLFRYAMELDIAEKNYAEYLYIKKAEKAEKHALTAQQLQILWDSVEYTPNARYILILCYTGMRLNEMLDATTANYHPDDGYFITGSKTEAGKDRVITISPKIRPFFDSFGKGDLLFFDRHITEKKFREDIFYPTLQTLGIDHCKPDGSHYLTPHCCRHTFATLMKNVDAPATDKQKLIGHSKFEMTAHYTHTDLNSLKKITDNL